MSGGGSAAQATTSVEKKKRRGGMGKEEAYLSQGGRYLAAWKKRLLGERKGVIISAANTRN